MYTFPNGKMYIGITSRTLAQRQGARWQGYSRCTHLWRAIQKYGYKNIKQNILLKAVISDEQAGILEMNYIALYDTANPNVGYNIRLGGDGSQPKKIDNNRKQFLAEQIRKLGTLNRNRPVSAETRAKQRAAKLGKKRSPHSQETKAKIAKANSAENMTEETRIRRSLSKQKKVVAENNLTQQQLIFDSVSTASEYFHVQPSAVSRWISGNRNPTNNFTFRFMSPTTTE